MKQEYREQEKTELTPRQRLDCTDKMLDVLGFFKKDEQLDDGRNKYKDLDDNEYNEFRDLRNCIMAAKESNVEQFYFEKLKDFFVKKMGYDADLFRDENLAQFTQQFNNLLKEDKERDEIAQKFIPDVEKRIHELNIEGIRLRAIEPRTREIENKIQTIMNELKKLRARREQVVEPVYKTRHKKVVN